MKTALRLFCLLLLVGVGRNNLNAQCTASDILISNIVPIGVQTAGSCHASFDLSFTMDANNGNKYIFVHMWDTASYPNFFNCVNGTTSENDPPESGDLVDAFLNLAINNNTGGDPVLLTSYPPDAAVVLNTATSIDTTLLPNGDIQFVIHDVVATLPGDCNGPIVIAADFWSSQSANGQVAHCVSCNLRYALNFLNVGGLANCAQLSFNATFTNRIGATLSGYYITYADVDGNGFLSTSVDALIQDTTYFTIAGNGNLAVSGTIPLININQSILFNVVITSPANGQSIFMIPTTFCTPLPVTFKSFTAVRTSQSLVVLRWETATESNCYGFAIQRNMGNNNWQTIGFVSSKAINGNSEGPLSYTYTDMNNSKGITQYRIQQIDLDGRSRFSDIRAVRGFGQSPKILVYPNPSVEGRVYVTFEEKEGIRDAILVDGRGQTIRQWKGVSGNTLVIENLSSGMYYLKVLTRGTGEQVVEKIIIAGE
jgi:hypothetical protein